MKQKYIKPCAEFVSFESEEDMLANSQETSAELGPGGNWGDWDE